MGKERFESAVSEVGAFVVGLQVYAGGVQVPEGVADFDDPGLVVSR